MFKFNNKALKLLNIIIALVLLYITLWCAIIWHGEKIIHNWAKQNNINYSQIKYHGFPFLFSYKIISPEFTLENIALYKTPINFKSNNQNLFFSGDQVTITTNLFLKKWKINFPRELNISNQKDNLIISNLNNEMLVDLENSMLFNNIDKLKISRTHAHFNNLQVKNHNITIDKFDYKYDFPNEFNLNYAGIKHASIIERPHDFNLKFNLTDNNIKIQQLKINSDKTSLIVSGWLKLHQKQMLNTQLNLLITLEEFAAHQLAKNNNFTQYITKHANSYELIENDILNQAFLEIDYNRGKIKIGKSKKMHIFTLLLPLLMQLK